MVGSRLFDTFPSNLRMHLKSRLLIIIKFNGKAIFLETKVNIKWHLVLQKDSGGCIRALIYFHSKSWLPFMLIHLTWRRVDPGRFDVCLHSWRTAVGKRSRFGLCDSRRQIEDWGWKCQKLISIYLKECFARRTEWSSVVNILESKIVCLICTRGYVFIDFREREKGEGRERSIDRLPSVCALTRNRTCNLLVYGTMLPPTEPPGQGWRVKFWSPSMHLFCFSIWTDFSYTSLQPLRLTHCPCSYGRHTEPEEWEHTV